jgi:hypothetical protein
MSPQIVPNDRPASLSYDSSQFAYAYGSLESQDSSDSRTTQVSLQGNGNGVLNPAAAYDPFVATPGSLTGNGVTSHPVQGNPYSHDAAAAVAASMGGAAFFSGQAGFQQPVQYHLYAPIGPHSQNISAYQRNVHDLFLPNDFREELQKKAAATLQTLPSKLLYLLNHCQELTDSFKTHLYPRMLTTFIHSFPWICPTRRMQLRLDILAGFTKHSRARMAIFTFCADLKGID